MKYKIKSFNRFIDAKKREMEPQIQSPSEVPKEHIPSEPVEKGPTSTLEQEIELGKKKRKKKRGGDIQ